MQKNEEKILSKLTLLALFVEIIRTFTEYLILLDI